MQTSRIDLTGPIDLIDLIDQTDLIDLDLKALIVLIDFTDVREQLQREFSSYQKDSNWGESPVSLLLKGRAIRTARN